MKVAKPDFVVLWTRICLEDDIKSFEVLYRYLYNSLHKLALYYVREQEVAEDIIAEIFVRCWENRKENTHIQQPESYFFVAVRNQSLKYLKKKSGTTFIDLAENEAEHPVEAYTPESLLERKELHHKLDHAIETLPAQAKLVFRLIKENGLKYKEVADILEISPRTVQTQLFRAIAKLRLVLKSEKPSGFNAEIGEKLISMVILLGIITFFKYVVGNF